MSLRPHYTFAEYLEIERRSRDVKHEYVAGAIFAMAGGSVEHSALASAFVGSPPTRIIVEVLSQSSERYDREQKRLYYQQLEALREYVLIAQDRRRVELWWRTEEGWSQAIHEAGNRAALRSIDYVLDVDELYDTAGVCP